MKDKTLVYVAVGGAAVIGLVLYMRSRAQAQPMLPAAAVPGTGPTLSSVATGVVTNLFGGLIKKATTTTATGGQGIGTFPVPANLDSLTKSRGATHHLTWLNAWTSKQPMYSVGARCFSTTTGAEVPIKTAGCSVAMLEGY